MLAGVVHPPDQTFLALDALPAITPTGVADFVGDSCQDRGGLSSRNGPSCLCLHGVRSDPFC